MQYPNDVVYSSHCWNMYKFWLKSNICQLTFCMKQNYDAGSKTIKEKNHVLFMQPLNNLGIGSSMRKESFGTRTLRIVLDTAETWSQDSATQAPKNEDSLFNPESASNLIRIWKR